MIRNDKDGCGGLCARSRTLGQHRAELAGGDVFQCAEACVELGGGHAPQAVERAQKIRGGAAGGWPPLNSETPLGGPSLRVCFMQGWGLSTVLFPISILYFPAIQELSGRGLSRRGGVPPENTEVRAQR
jgi:hypothetical protein